MRQTYPSICLGSSQLNTSHLQLQFLHRSGQKRSHDKKTSL